MLVKDKVIVVTGAGSGIGSALTEELLGRGARVAAVDLREGSLKDLKKSFKEVGERLSVHQLDISDKKGVEALPGAVIKAHGSVDGIINNAGIIQPFIKINELEYDTIERVMNINFYGTVYMVKAFLPELLKRPEAHIVNVSSMGGFLPVPGQSIYGASKAAVKLMTEGLYSELKETNIGVSIVFPGATATNITENSGVKTPKLPQTKGKQKEYPTLSSSEAASIIVSGVEKNKLQIFTGNDSNFMNKLYRMNPKFATDLIAKQMKALLG